MKRQPIASAAVFFVLSFVQVETHNSVGECVDKACPVTDCIFCPVGIY